MRTLLLFMLLIFTGQLFSQEALWLRYPALSPDGSTIVFEYQGDLYTVNSHGGLAQILTLHPAYDYMPIWSPDGKTIAFASNRFGNFDIYSIPADGGKPIRLTFHSANEKPSCFSPDGNNILFSASIFDNRENQLFPSGIMNELYSVPVKGGRIVQLFSTPAENAVYDKSSRYIYYHDRKGMEDSWRKHHRSAEARDIWRFDTQNHTHEKIIDGPAEDRSPVISPDGSSVYFLSERDSTFNIWKQSLADLTKEPVQITKFKNHPVRFLSVSQTGRICFSWNGSIYLMDEGKEPVKLTITVKSDEKNNGLEYIKQTSGASEMAVKPDEKEVAFIIRGEVFVTQVAYNTTKRITNTPAKERWISWSPDGKSLIYSSERNGNWTIYRACLAKPDETLFSRATVINEEMLISTGSDAMQPAFSPDGKEIAFFDARTTLTIYNLETKQMRVVLDGKLNYSYTDGDQYFQWSPDSKWLAVSYTPAQIFVSEAGLVAADGKSQIVNLTQSGYNDNSPSWMMKGNCLIWFSDRDGFRSHGSWGAEDDVYAMFLNQKAFDRFKLSREELDLLKEKEKKDKEEADKQKEKNKDKKKKNEENIKTDSLLQIDLDNLEERTARLTIHSSNLADAVLTADGDKLYYLSQFEDGYDLWMNDLKKNETRLVLKLKGYAGSMKLGKDEKILFMVSNGEMIKVDLNSFSKETIGFNAEFTVNLALERQYMFEHVYRYMKEKFYDKNLHGVAWEYYKQEYEKFLPYINNNIDFSEMLSEMLGELNASHTGSGYNYTMPNADQTASLGVFYDWSYTGNGVKIAEIMEKGPLTLADINIKAGQIIEKIDDQELIAGQDFYRFLNQKAGKPVLLSVYDPLTQKRWQQVVTPVTPRQENELLYQRWIKNRRMLTSKLSGGKIGYAHVRAMDSRSFREAYSEILGRNVQKEALVVDIRFNGGGWLHDDLSTLLSGKKYYTFAPRGVEMGIDPMNKWTKPSAVLVCEADYSNGHGFPYTYKALGIGKIIGTPIAGTMTAVWWETLIDNSLYFGIPQVGVKGNDGKYLENQEFFPDVEVYQNPDEVVKGRDIQLEKAVEELLKTLK